MIKTTEQERKQIFFEDHYDYDLVEELPTEDEGKTQYCCRVFKNNKNNKFYFVNATRSGSYYTDYEYEFYDELEECQKVTKTIETWDVIKGE